MSVHPHHKDTARTDRTPAPGDALGYLSNDALAALTARSNRKGLAHLALHLLAITATGALYAGAFGSAWMLPAAWIYGACLVFLFAPLHETVHYTAFRSRRLNRAVSVACGWVLLLPPRRFRAFHLEHHRWTQDSERDPELAVPPHARGVNIYGGSADCRIGGPRFGRCSGTRPGVWRSRTSRDRNVD